MDKITNQAELLSYIAKNPRLEALLTRARNSNTHDSAHDTSHLLRVALWTLKFLPASSPQTDSAIAAALLHDLVNVPKNHPDRARASTLSAEKAEPLLRELGFADTEIAGISSAIRDHSFSAGRKPGSPLGMALQDADRLEALGALGLFRLISTGVKMGAKYFHDEDPWAKNRARDDKAFSLDHFFTKLLTLQDTMNTRAGQEEARRRSLYLENFLTELGTEIGEDYASTRSGR